VARYELEKTEIQAAAKKLETEANRWDAQSEEQMHQHHRWAQATTVLQVSIALAAIALVDEEESGWSGPCSAWRLQGWQWASWRRFTSSRKTASGADAGRIVAPRGAASSATARTTRQPHSGSPSPPARTGATRHVRA